MSARQNIKKRASQWGALFVACIFFISPIQAKDCPANHIDENVQVAKVIDGDTLKLKDGRLVRLIGINTPEMARKDRPAEPFAKQAKLALKLLLGESEPEGTTVGLQFDAERKDRHGRTLAHVYLQSGKSIQAELLSTGLAAHIVVPPNIGNLRCYREAEHEARKTSEGVWSSLYQPISVESLPRDTKGFRIISGRVINVGESRQSIWLNFPRRPDEGKR